MSRALDESSIRSPSRTPRFTDTSSTDSASPRSDVEDSFAVFDDATSQNVLSKFNGTIKRSNAADSSFTIEDVCKECNLHSKHRAGERLDEGIRNARFEMICLLCPPPAHRRG